MAKVGLIHAESNSNDGSVFGASFSKSVLMQRLENELRRLMSLKQDVIDTNEGDSICFLIESAFLHGIRRLYLKKASNFYVFTEPRNKKVNMGFWKIIEQFLNKSDRQTVISLSRIYSDIGRFRSWIRIILNDGLVSSYVRLFADNSPTLSTFYQPWAFIRHAEYMKCLVDLLELAEKELKFQIEHDAPSLNKWSTTGIGHQSINDVSQSKKDDNIHQHTVSPVSSNISDVMISENHPSSLNKFCYDLTEDDMFQVLISDRNSPLSRRGSRVSTPIPVTCSPSSSIFYVPRHENTELPSSSTSTSYVLPNNDEADPQQNENNVSVPDDSVFDSIYECPIIHEGCSDKDYKISVEAKIDQKPMKYDNKGGLSPIIKSASQISKEKIQSQSEVSPKSGAKKSSYIPNRRCSSASLNVTGPYLLSGFVDVFLRESAGTLFFDSHPPHSDCQQWSDPSLGQSQNIKLPVTNVSVLNVSDTNLFTSLLDKFCEPLGLPAQGYKCDNCSKVIGGSLFGEAYECYYTGRFFCNECHTSETSIIPAHILYNFDFTPQSVSRKAKQFIDAVRDMPIIELSAVNPILYTFSDEIAEVFLLKRKLSRVYPYLVTCRDRSREYSFPHDPSMTNLRLQSINPIKEFISSLECRSYKRDEIHLYSLNDLIHIDSLLGVMRRVLDISAAHVHGCLFCSGLGFTCQICLDRSAIIFPFDDIDFNQCKECYSMVHVECVASHQDTCPKCERVKSRQLNSLVAQAQLDKLLREQESCES